MQSQPSESLTKENLGPKEEAMFGEALEQYTGSCPETPRMVWPTEILYPFCDSGAKTVW